MRNIRWSLFTTQLSTMAAVMAATALSARCDETMKPPSTGPKPTVAVMQARDNSKPAPNTFHLMQQRLADVGFSVVDVTNRQTVISEQAMASDGQVTPATQTRLGRMLGVNYLAIFRVDLSATNQQRTGILSILSNTPSFVTKIILSDKLQFVDVKSGAIVQSMEDTRDVTSPVFQGGQNQTFLDEELPKLRAASVDALIAKIDRNLFITNVDVHAINGKILDVTGSTVTISLGSANRVNVGQIVDFYDTKTVLNPDTNKSILTVIKRGSLQVTQVESDYSIGFVLPASAKPIKLQVVRFGTQ